jgi:hypothetical protein
VAVNVTAFPALVGVVPEDDPSEGLAEKDGAVLSISMLVGVLTAKAVPAKSPITNIGIIVKRNFFDFIFIFLILFYIYFIISVIF